MSQKQPKLPNRQQPFSEKFRDFIAEGWEDYDSTLPAPLPASNHTAPRRDRIAKLFPESCLVVPAGGLKVRANDTDYDFRPNSAFAYLSGLGADREPDAVLVLPPDAPATLFFRPRSPRTESEFYADPRYGEMWVGQRESLEEMAALVQMPVADIRSLTEFLTGYREQLVVLRNADVAVTEQVDQIRGTTRMDEDERLETELSEMRLVKDDFEIAEMRKACEASAASFEAVIAELPDAVARGRGERWIEGTFWRHARLLGNDVGYHSVVAGGDHANTLHWIRNTGDLDPSEVLLLDAGVEVESLYTADITRTLPIGGKFSPAQREVYNAVLEAQSAGIAAAIPGNKFLDVHKAAIAVVAKYLHKWGILPVTAEESLSPEGGQHRRWMVHGTGHHLGIDVHDCAQARNENYRDGTLEPGMIITVEPGIYFKSTDLLVPERFRGIGVRIEDDILITEDGNENLSGMLPREADAVEAWIAKIQA